jgi:hypothetical protein
MKQQVIFVVSGQAVNSNAKINWPDLNFPGSGQTILRYLHHVDFDELTVQLDGEDGPKFCAKDLPAEVGFYKKIVK